MSTWGAAKDKRVFADLLRLGWSVKRTSGSHTTLARADHRTLRVSRTVADLDGPERVTPDAVFWSS